MQKAMKIAVSIVALFISPSAHSQMQTFVVCDNAEFIFETPEDYWGEAIIEYAADSLNWESIDIELGQPYAISSELSGFYRLRMFDADCDTSYISDYLKVIAGTAITDDRDGKVYCTVEIGEQEWFAENLRYDPPGIPEVSGDVNWAAIWNNGNPTEQPAWCYYDDNAANDATYGKLYNWYAVNTGTLCPDGWHIPTDEEWQILELELGMPTDEVNTIGWRGGAQNVGGKMKSTTGWNSPNTGATNESGFAGLQGGFRYYIGDFSDIGNYGYWWSSSESFSFGPWFRFLNYVNEVVYRGNSNKTHGYSCRCVRD
jgi:uncharacterized protein (TIGR02145 family)